MVVDKSITNHWVYLTYYVTVLGLNEPLLVS